MTSNESSEVRWVKKQEALGMVTFPLTKKRLEIMLSENNTVHCFGFKKEPFDSPAECNKKENDISPEFCHETTEVIVHFFKKLSDKILLFFFLYLCHDSTLLSLKYIYKYVALNTTTFNYTEKSQKINLKGIFFASPSKSLCILNYFKSTFSSL